MAVRGPVELEGGEAFAPVALGHGDTALIPASLGARCVVSGGGETSILVARV
jgi:hypothetical protein